MPAPLRLGIFDQELRRHRGVFHVTVASRLVQLMARQTGTGRRRIGLDGIAFVEQSLVIQLLQQPPQSLDIFVIVGDIGMVKVNKIAHLLGKLTPFGRKLHHILPTAMVILLHGDIFFRCLVVYIFLRYPEILLHSKLHRQTVGIPTGLARHTKPLHGFQTADGVLDGTRNDVVNARTAVGGRRTFIKHKRFLRIALLHAALKDLLLFPKGQHFFFNFRKIQFFRQFFKHTLRLFFA